MTRVLIAADKFKGSLAAATVGSAITSGIRRVVGDAVEIITIPVADGGDGTVAAAVAAGFASVPVTAAGPTGELVESAWARRGSTAVIEMADVCGLVRLPGGRPDPLGATSRGLGEVIAAAIDRGCTEVVVGIGGSASTDGGSGMLQALGARLLDVDGNELGRGGGSLANLVAIDLAPLRNRVAGVTFTVASDVDNPLTGPRGAAAVYGPQKGATPHDVVALDAALSHFAEVVHDATGAGDCEAPGAGAAGGVGYSAQSVLGAILRPGIDIVFDLVGFHEALAPLGPGDLVITGEGSLDEQTLNGKAPAGVAAAAVARGIPAVAVCGRNRLPTDRLAQWGISAVYTLMDVAPDPDTSRRHAARLLGDLGERIAHDHLAT